MIELTSIKIFFFCFISTEITITKEIKDLKIPNWQKLCDMDISICDCTSVCWNDGKCNPYLHNAEHCWDGGDCWHNPDDPQSKCDGDSEAEAEFCRKTVCDCNKMYLSPECEFCCPPIIPTIPSSATETMPIPTILSVFLFSVVINLSYIFAY